LRTNHRAILATYRRDGSIQMSPILIGVDDEGMPVISSRETAYKVRNLRRDPRASVCVFGDGFFGEWIQIDGTAVILSLPEAMEPLVAYYRSVVGEHPDWGDYRQAMVRENRLLLNHLKTAFQFAALLTAIRTGPGFCLGGNDRVRPERKVQYLAANVPADLPRGCQYRQND
jgi:PPOX class probable F420-dependent enzyme